MLCKFIFSVVSRAPAKLQGNWRPEASKLAFGTFTHLLGRDAGPLILADLQSANSKPQPSSPVVDPVVVWVLPELNVTFAGKALKVCWAKVCIPYNMISTRLFDSLS